MSTIGKGIYETSSIRWISSDDVSNVLSFIPIIDSTSVTLDLTGITGNENVWITGVKDPTTSSTPDTVATKNYVDSSATPPSLPEFSIQFNSSDVFTGSSDLLWDYTVSELQVNGNIINNTESFTINSIEGGTMNVATNFTTGTLNIGAGTAQVNFNSTLDAIDSTSASVVIKGGLGVAKKVFCTGLTVASGNAVGISETSEIVDTVSLRRFKENESIFDRPDDILKLQPKFFDWKSAEQDNPNRHDLGLIVEDAVDEGLDYLLFKNLDGMPKNFKDRSLIAGIIALLKKQQREIDEIKQVISSLNLIN